MKEQLRTILSATSGLPASSITDQANLSRDLGLDSLDTVDLVLQMEDQFHVSIPDEDYSKLQTVGEICEYLRQKTTIIIQ
ncbi:acyl carrier protein [Dyadobacter sp. NIV53]|uniref:acyl carrier protein n=1 Tax=Dyadobacter sp. NIV53 TaxID=2861765 RepID=UPI001C8855F7|nr:acyl carrier protein [Dyadobacter sp. NIV53]